MRLSAEKDWRSFGNSRTSSLSLRRFSRLLSILADRWRTGYRCPPWRSRTIGFPNLQERCPPSVGILSFPSAASNSKGECGGRESRVGVRFSCRFCPSLEKKKAFSLLCLSVPRPGGHGTGDLTEAGDQWHMDEKKMEEGHDDSPRWFEQLKRRIDEMNDQRSCRRNPSGPGGSPEAGGHDTASTRSAVRP